jgi:hypothetical protein
LHVRSIIAPKIIVPGKYPSDLVIVDLNPSENARWVGSTLYNIHFNAGTITQHDIKTTINAPHNVITKFMVHFRSVHRPKIVFCRDERKDFDSTLPTLTVLFFGKHKQSA